ncbi:Ig-like domain-containing protein [Pantoea sp. SS70]|uniref:Ig-like domain-containing protein n=1 Tax=Pantoea sp. SS70 TaxID=3024247 RepID=UPI002452B314|nr:Ig-like domain-containing protein [Pantoea sp. SS70]WGK55890.1 Ig-like domain-containing protein [Pantoea sp. SS70]
MNDLLARSPVFYRESADGRLVFGNKTALEPGGFIELVIGTDTFRVPVDDKGFYRWEAATPYADGEYSFSIRHFDAAGNRSTPTLGTVIVDTTPPSAPDLINLYDDQGAVTGSFDAGKATDDKRPTLTGIAQKGSTVYLLNDKNEKIGSAVADKVTGKWVMEPSQDLNDGVNSLRLMAEETFGGKLRAGAPSEAFDIVIAGEDVKVTITDALDDAGSFTGSLGHGALTDDATPTLRGEVSAGSTVIVYYRLAGSPTWAGSATATVSGDSWSWTPGSNLPDGRYEFQASTGEVASVLFELEIAGTAGIAQRTRIESVTDDFGPVTGPLANGAMTDDATPTFQGRAEANSQVVIRYTLAGGAAASVTVNADSTGHWNWTPGVSLATGQWTFDVKSQGQSGWNDSFTLTINPDADRNATIDGALDDFGPVTGSLSSGSSTDDTTPTLRGSGPANGSITLRYKLGSGEYASTTVNVDSAGKWTWTPSALAKGSWTFEVQKAGQSDWSSFTLTVDPTLDRNATINGAYDDFGTVKGIIANGGITDDATPTLNGSGPANSVISLRYKLGSGGYASTTVNVDAAGNWTWTPSALASGKWTFEVQKPGQSGWSSFTLTIDPTVDRKPTIDSAWDDVGPTTGLISNGGTTDDSTPTLRGTGPANSTLMLRYFRLATMFDGTIKVDASGNWTWTAPELTDGNWTFEVKKEGQHEWSSYELNIDSSADRYPTIDGAWDDAGPVTGSLSSGNSTDDTTPTLRGSGPANGSITLRYKLDGGSYASTTVNVDSAGKWTWTPSALAKGSWTFEVQKAGQSGWSSFTLTIDPALDLKPTIDSAWDDFGAVTGSLASGDATDDSTPTLRGRGVAGSVIYFQSGTWDGAWENAGSTVVKADGSWEWTSPALSHNTTWEFRAMARHDGAESEWSGKFVLEYNNPAPTITDAFDDFGAETGSLASGDTTDDNTPTLRGTAPADSVVMIRAQYASGETTYSVKADVDGKWSWTPDKGLAKGDWNFQVKQSEAENWGETFELNITKEYSGNWGILDFENLAGQSFETESKARFSVNSKLYFIGNSTGTFFAKVAETPDNAPANWGNQCLSFLKPGGFDVLPNELNWGKSSTFSEFGCNIWNSGSRDATVTFRYQVSDEITYKEIKFIVKAGELFTFDSTDYTGIGISHYKAFSLYFEDNFAGIYLDNLYTVEQDILIPPVDFDGPENIVHFLDGVDELTDHPITGSESLVDTLQLTGKDQLLDLSQHQAEIQSVEIFDIRGSGDNTLKIDLDALLHYGEKDLFIEDGKTQLMVNGDAGDVVQLKDILPEGSDISEWQHQQGTVTVAGVEYEVYSHGDDAELLVQQGVKTELI